MAGVGPGDLHTLATGFLDACIESLDTIPTYDATLGGAPARTFVAGGPIALDCCDQLAVYVSPISEGDSAVGIPKASFARINRVALTVTASRCVPVPDSNGNPPPALEQEEAGRQINADKWALWNHLYHLIRIGELFDQCGDVVWGPLSPLQPNGGCGGSTLTIIVSFDGYEELLGS